MDVSARAGSAGPADPKVSSGEKAQARRWQ